VHREQALGAGWQWLAAAVHREDDGRTAGLRLADCTGFARHRGRSGDVGRYLAHPQRLIQLGAGVARPLLEQSRWGRFTSDQTMAQDIKRAAFRPAVLEDLAIKRRHAREDCRAGGGDEPRPERGILGSRVDDPGGAVRPRIGEPRAESVGPVEGAGVQNAVRGRDPVPAVVHRPPSPRGPVRMQHTLRPCGRPGGVDKEGGIVCPRVLIARPFGIMNHLQHAPAIEHLDPLWDRADTKVLRKRDSRGTAVLEQEVGFVLGELARRGQRHAASGNRAEEEERVGAGVVEPDHDAGAARQPLRPEGGRDAQHRILERAVRAHLRGRLQRILDHQQRGFVRDRRGCTSDAIGGHVEPLWRRRAAIAVEARHFLSSTHHVSKSTPNSAVCSGMRR
jgi:hypothetical protein